MNQFLILLFLFVASSIANAKILNDFPFDDYPAKEAVSKKAKLKLGSNKLGKTFKTAITEGYQNGDNNFAGHYVAVFWGCGTGCSQGAIVDSLDGKIYSLPLEHSYRGAYIEDNDNIKFNKNSRLLVTYDSERMDDSSNKVKLSYYYYVLDEKTKKFNVALTKIEETIEE